MRRWSRRPEGANWGEFGDDDALGRVNLLTPEKVLQAVAEVREGVSFCLSLPLDYPGKSALNPRRFPPQIQYSMRGDDPAMCYPLARLNPGQTDVVCDDRVTLSTQYSTQWDSLAHMGALFDADGDGQDEVVFYNGYRAGEHVRGPRDYLDGDRELPPPYGAGPLGIDALAAACMQGRGVLVDLHAHYGKRREAIGYEALMQVLEADGVSVEPGDILCLRTGFDRVLLDAERDPPEGIQHEVCTGLDGSDPKLLQWITDSGVAAILADNEAVEFLPTPNPPAGRGAHFPLHEHCLFKLGVPLGELFLLSDLADWLRAAGRYRFLLTAPPLRLPGAVGSPVSAVATV
ncbi:cyclase family protein [Mangrovimicrobium sediminis]|uniref:Cyclase family protein n=1 Tax=Mangrovimicrobium sediminis TaxID=2562682 RepID=A0A4Z0LVE7_9GAMM|nr:cyclase family protein [Haliea sp. SAOS-164]